MSTRAKIVIAGVIVAALVGLVVLDISSSPRNRSRGGAAPGTNSQNTVWNRAPSAPGDRTPLPPNPFTNRPLEIGTPAADNMATAAPAAAPAGTAPTGPAASTSPVVAVPEPPVEIRETETADAATRTYVVRPGDSFWKIAQQEYGDGSLMNLIRDANPAVNADTLPLGTVLTIPARPERRAAEPAPAAEGSGSDEIYTVRSGDALETIALRKYQNRGLARAIFEANRDVLTNPNTLSVGMRLRLPNDLAEHFATTPGIGHGEGRPVPAGARVHRVESGDSLWKIASRNANGRSVQTYIDEIVRENRDLLTGGRDTVLQPGWEIVLP